MLVSEGVATSEDEMVHLEQAMKDAVSRLGTIESGRVVHTIPYHTMCVCVCLCVCVYVGVCV